MSLRLSASLLLLSWLSFLIQVVPVNTLLCYSCDNERDNSRCNNNVTGNIQVCEDGFDACQTMVKYSSDIQQLQITKFCTKYAPCRHQQNISSLEDAPCDLARDTWACVSCCKVDLCNFSHGHRHGPPLRHGLITGLSCLLLCWYMSGDIYRRLLL